MLFQFVVHYSKGRNTYANPIQLSANPIQKSSSYQSAMMECETEIGGTRQRVVAVDPGTLVQI